MAGSVQTCAAAVLSTSSRDHGRQTDGSIHDSPIKCVLVVVRLSGHAARETCLTTMMGGVEEGAVAIKGRGLGIHSLVRAILDLQVHLIVDGLLYQGLTGAIRPPVLKLVILAS
jgi:hypothetical protein